MKKLIISLAVIVSFGGYVFSARKSKSIEIANIVPTPAPAAFVTAQSRLYKDGEYTGNSVDAYYGFIQVKATIQNGNLTNVTFLKYPNDIPTSREINETAIPVLTREAIAAQSAQVDIVSGATDSAGAFIESLGSALTQAKV